MSFVRWLNFLFRVAWTVVPRGPKLVFIKPVVTLVDGPC